MQNKIIAQTNPFDVFEEAVSPAKAPHYKEQVLMIKGGPKGDMDKKDV